MKVNEQDSIEYFDSDQSDSGPKSFELTESDIEDDFDIESMMSDSPKFKKKTKKVKSNKIEMSSSDYDDEEEEKVEETMHEYSINGKPKFDSGYQDEQWFGKRKDETFHQPDFDGKDAEQFNVERCEAQVAFSPLEEIFPGFMVDMPAKTFTLPANSQQIFKELDYSSFLSLSLEYNFQTRICIREVLAERGIDVLEHLNRETDFLIRTTMIGMFSTKEVYHTLVIKNAIKNKDILELVRIIVLKTNEMIEAIKGNYKEIFGNSLMQDIEELGGEEAAVLKKVLTIKRYCTDVLDDSWEAEAFSVNDMIYAGDCQLLSKFFLSFTHGSFKKICTTYYRKFAYSLIDDIFQSSIPPIVCKIFEIMHKALIAPQQYYASLIEDMVKLRKPCVYLPYNLICLDNSGLKAVMTDLIGTHGTFFREIVSETYDDVMKHLILGLIKKNIQ